MGSEKKRPDPVNATYRGNGIMSEAKSAIRKPRLPWLRSPYVRVTVSPGRSVPEATRNTSASAGRRNPPCMPIMGVVSVVKLTSAALVSMDR